jgi:hypothetical protein
VPSILYDTDEFTESTWTPVTVYFEVTSAATKLRWYSAQAGSTNDELLIDNVRLTKISKLHNDATQATVASMPTIVSAGALVTDANGNVALDFDGTDDYLEADGVAASFTGEDKPYTAVAIINPADNASNQYILHLGRSSTTTPLDGILGITSAGQYRLQKRDDAGVLIGTALGRIGLETLLASSVSTGTTKYVEYYGTSETPVAYDVGTLTLDQFTIGAQRRTGLDSYYDGMFGGCVLYSADKSTELDAIKSAFQAALSHAYPINWETPGGFTNTGITYATDGTLWIADFDTGDVVNTSTSGGLISRVSTPAGATTLQGIAYDDSDDTLWVADKSSNLIRHITLAGAAIETIAFTAPNALAYNSATDEIWVAGDSTATITKYNASTLASAGTLVTGITGFDGLAFASDGNIWITEDSSPDKLYKVNSSSGATISTFYLPFVTQIEHVADDGTDQYICDDAFYHDSVPNGNRVWKITEDVRA